jgi:homopolymeric O-antigen transport system permease protein
MAMFSTSAVARVGPSPMKPHSVDHSGRYLLTHRRILLHVTRNELVARYAGSVLGVGWALLTPLVMIAIYAVVYLVIFRVQVPGLTPGQYVLFIFAGLVPFLMTSEALGSGVGSVIANKAVLSNTVFPIDLAPPKAVLLSQVPMVVGMSAILLVAPFVGTLSWTISLLPLVWILHVMALTGLVWMLSLVGLVFRDLQNLVQLLLLMMMIASPIAYTPSMVPRSLRPLLILNPFAYFVTTYQHVLVLGTLPSLWLSLVLVVMSVGLFLLGGRFFARAKRALIDYV